MPPAARARTRTSPAGRTRAPSRGFTLVELLVVLGIAALLLALAAPMAMRALPGTALKTAAQDVADGLRRVRSEAIVSNAEQGFVVDVESRRARLGSRRAPLVLPPEVSLRLVVGDTEVDSHRQGGIRFFPDGSSTGGRVTLALEGRAYDVGVDWLTGRVTLEGPRADEG